MVVVPREGYHREPATLRHLLDDFASARTPVLVVHEARCPERVERSVTRLAAAGSLRHLHLRGPAGANRCRVAGLAEVTTPYTLFLDNDARLAPGSIGRLVALARTTGASFVSPLCCNPDGTVHYGGSVVRFTGVEGRRQLLELRLYTRQPAEEVRASLDPSRTDAPELHGVLVDTEMARAVGAPDPALQSAMDCLDLGLRLQDVGGGGWLEPTATVEFANARPRPCDLPLYLDRWSRSTIERDLAHFTATWSLDPGSPRLDEHRRSLAMRRWRALPWVRGGLRRLLGEGAVESFEGMVDPWIDRLAARARARGT